MRILRGTCIKRGVLSVALVMVVTWVSFTRPFATLYPFLYSHESLKAAAMTRNEVRSQEARRYFSRLPKRSLEEKDIYDPSVRHKNRRTGDHDQNVRENQQTENNKNLEQNHHGENGYQHRFPEQDAAGEFRPDTGIHANTQIRQNTEMHQSAEIHHNTKIRQQSEHDTPDTEKPHTRNQSFSDLRLRTNQQTAGVISELQTHSDVGVRPNEDMYVQKGGNNDRQLQSDHDLHDPNRNSAERSKVSPLQGFGADSNFYRNSGQLRSHEAESSHQNVRPVRTADPGERTHAVFNEDVRQNSQASHSADPHRQEPQVFTYDNHQRHSNVRYAIAIITTRRFAPSVPSSSVVGEMDYVLQTAAALDAMMRGAREFANSVLFLCNVDRVPQEHTLAVYLKDYLHYAERFGNSSFDLSQMKTPFLHGSTYRNFRHDGSTRRGVLEKERLDYMFCMQAAFTFDPRYVIMVEDDALPHPDVPSVLENVVGRIASRRDWPVCTGSAEFSISPCSFSYKSPSVRTTRNETPDVHNFSGKNSFENAKLNVTSNFAFLKLFLPEKWRGFYLFDPLRMIDLISVGAVGATLFLLLVCISSPRPSSFEPTWRTYFLGFLLSLFIAFLVGRVNLNELRRVSKHFYRVEPTPGCCTPATLYPADVIPPLLTWMADSPRGRPLDFVVDRIATVLGLPAFCVEPVLFRHIGMVSTLKHSSVKVPEEFLLA